MNTILKFKCSYIKSEENNPQQEVILEPVTNGSEENKEFYKWTPSGQLNFHHVNPNVKFETQKEYYINITEA